METENNFLLWVPPFLSYELWKQRIELSKSSIQTGSKSLNCGFVGISVPTANLEANERYNFTRGKSLSLSLSFYLYFLMISSLFMCFFLVRIFIDFETGEYTQIRSFTF